MLSQQSKHTTPLQTVLVKTIESRIRLTKNDCLILRALLQAMDNTQCCYISLNSLKEKTGLPSATLCARLTALRANKIIEKHTDFAENGSFMTNCYQIIQMESVEIFLNSEE